MIVSRQAEGICLLEIMYGFPTNVNHFGRPTKCLCTRILAYYRRIVSRQAEGICLLEIMYMCRFSTNMHCFGGLLNVDVLG